MLCCIKSTGPQQISRLVIVTGCGHAGIINTMNYAKKLSGINKIYAVLGGFHLMGDVVFQEAIEPTVNELQKADPKYVIPCHCTGWKGTNRIIDTMPEKFIQSSVGFMSYQITNQTGSGKG